MTLCRFGLLARPCSARPFLSRCEPGIVRAVHSERRSRGQAVKLIFEPFQHAHRLRTQPLLLKSAFPGTNSSCIYWQKTVCSSVRRSLGISHEFQKVLVKDLPSLKQAQSKNKKSARRKTLTVKNVYGSNIRRLGCTKTINAPVRLREAGSGISTLSSKSQRPTTFDDYLANQVWHSEADCLFTRLSQKSRASTRK